MKKFIVGIDLGTTHTVVAYAPLSAPPSHSVSARVRLLDIAQLIAPGEVAALPLLPSARYHPAEGEIAGGELQLPWPSPDVAVIGRWARQRGAQVPGRLVSSAKSWLSHTVVDRLAPILPWGAAADVPKVSPVQASASYLSHVRAAWNHQFPHSPLEQQDLVLTVPASFDEGARALTLNAAQLAGLPHLRLLEEPQAVFYDWLFRHRSRLAQELAQTRLVLVCDVGGGTTDLSLIQVEMRDGEPLLTRRGVGKHLMLGGDNMDLALAHVAEARLADPATGVAAAPLSASRLSQLMERCRAAKELLLAADAPAQTQVTLLGGGSRLIGASRSIPMTREEVEHLIVDGFFPRVAATDSARPSRSGLVEFGLPYARDPAITRHIADFLRRHALEMPDTLLLNGGVFRADALVKRLQQVLAEWRGAPLHLLHNDNPDVAVARGAVAYALSQQGLAPKIGGGAARSYFLLLDHAGDSPQQRGICILPQGSEPGQEVPLAQQIFALRLGQPVRFHLFTSIANTAGQAPFERGELVTLDPQNFDRLPPIAMVLQAHAHAGKTDGNVTPRQDIAVQLVTSLTEVGTLEMHCVSLSNTHQRWLLAFDLRQTPTEADAQPLVDCCSHPNPMASTRITQAMGKIDRIFGPPTPQVGAKDVKQLRAQLEKILGDRMQWPTALLRQLFDTLWQRARGRRRSAEHERVWLNLAGFCLRPGFGDPLDTWRVEQLWTLFESGVQHTNDNQVCTQWWTLWRRAAGGLTTPQQLRLLDDFAFNLHSNEQEGDDSPVKPVKGSDEDMLRLGASLERIPAAFKVEVGEWLLGRLQASTPECLQRSGPDMASDSRNFWALGRLGARQPLYGSTHDVVPSDTATTWIETLLQLDWRRMEPAAFAATHLARVTDDRTRDLPVALRERVIQRLTAFHAPRLWIDMVREKVQLDEATERRVLGESLPPGLKLMV